MNTSNAASTPTAREACKLHSTDCLFILDSLWDTPRQPVSARRRQQRGVSQRSKLANDASGVAFFFAGTKSTIPVDRLICRDGLDAVVPVEYQLDRMVIVLIQ